MVNFSILATEGNPDHVQEARSWKGVEEGEVDIAVEGPTDDALALVGGVS